MTSSQTNDVVHIVNMEWLLTYILWCSIRTVRPKGLLHLNQKARHHLFQQQDTTTYFILYQPSHSTFTSAKTSILLVVSWCSAESTLTMCNGHE